MGLLEKIANAKPTDWLTENMTDEEIAELVTEAKEKAREQIAAIESEDKDENTLI